MNIAQILATLPDPTPVPRVTQPDTSIVPERDSVQPGAVGGAE